MSYVPSIGVDRPPSRVMITASNNMFFYTIGTSEEISLPVIDECVGLQTGALLRTVSSPSLVCCVCYSSAVWLYFVPKMDSHAC